MLLICLMSGPVYGMSTSTVDDNQVVTRDSPDSQDTYVRSRVVAINEEGFKTFDDGSTQPFQKIVVQLAEGPDRGKNITIHHGGLFAIDTHQKVSVGDEIILTKPAHAATPDMYYVADHYRNGRLFVMVVLFFVLAVTFGGKRGLTALLGMVISTAIIFYGIAPRVLAGENPLIVTLIAGVIIIVLSVYISHGFTRRTSVAVVASLCTLAIAAALNYCAVALAHLTGGGTEEAFYLQIEDSPIDLRGLLMGGIMIGVLGVLDDVTTAQAAAVEELQRANPALSVRELYRRGLSIGKEHIASLVNTLVLAYVGAAFPVVLLYVSHKNIPLWLMFNSNFIAEEVVRTLVGSSALIIAVPLTTYFAARSFSTVKNDSSRSEL